MLCVSSFADIYKYKDKKGVTHFTNIPKNGSYKKILTEKKTPREKMYDNIIGEKSSKYNIDPAIVRAVIKTESDWDPGAVSHKGAMGLMQLMPSTAKDMKIINPFDPEDNIEGGTKYLRRMLKRFNGNLDLALAAYNAGPANVEKYGGIPAIRETSRFVKNIREIVKSSARKRESRIYKITYSDGTVLYTNRPAGLTNRLSNF